MITIWLLGGPLDGKSVDMDCNSDDFERCTIGYTQDGVAKSADYKRYSPPGQPGPVVGIHTVSLESPVETGAPYDKAVVDKAVDTILAHQPARLGFDELADRGDEIVRNKTYGLVELMHISGVKDDG